MELDGLPSTVMPPPAMTWTFDVTRLHRLASSHLFWQRNLQQENWICLGDGYIMSNQCQNVSLTKHQHSFTILN